MTRVLGPGGLEEIIAALRDGGRTVIGPVARDGVVTHDEIRSADDLPRGWTEDQEAGRYRLTPTGTDECFAYSSPSTSWKRFVLPERTLLVRAHRHRGVIRVEEPAPEPVPMAFFGIRSCDLAALGVLDAVFMDPDATDPGYASARRESAPFIVAVACHHPGHTCFCASMGTGPSPTSGYDLAVRELLDDDGLRYLIEPGSDRGAAMLDGLGGRDVTDAEEAAAGVAHETAVASMGRRLDPDDPPRAAEHSLHPRWDEVAERCLACGNCTMVCPTCFCTSTEDSTDLGATTAERWRVWDSCFTLDFSHLPGGSVRSSISSRYRQWLLHKLVTWHDQFGTSGCVGCGRCITWCPVGIDLTAEVAALAASPSADSDEGGAG